MKVRKNAEYLAKQLGVTGGINCDLENEWSTLIARAEMEGKELADLAGVTIDNLCSFASYLFPLIQLTASASDNKVHLDFDYDYRRTPYSSHTPMQN